MKHDAKNAQSNRRGFLRSLLGAEDPALAVERKALKNRAGVLALKYAKNEEKLLKLGVEAPVHIEDARFTVKVSGQNESGEAVDLDLEVDAEAKTVARIEAENSAT